MRTRLPDFAALFLLFYFCCGSIFPQYTYFIKYKNTVSSEEISKAVRLQRLPNSSKLSKASSALRLGYFARGLAGSIPELSGIIKITSGKELSQSELSSLASGSSSVEYVQKAAVYKIDIQPAPIGKNSSASQSSRSALLSALTNDSLYSQQWGLEKTGAPKAWQMLTRSDTVIVGVIDTGIDYLHPDINDNIYMNRGETGLDNRGRDKRRNGIDDDSNGFIDDFMGWDFTDRAGFPFDSSGGDYLGWDNDPKDEMFHGTFVAGIIAAEMNNGIGIAGAAAPVVKILNLRAFDPTGNGEEDDAAAAILYAVQAGARLINMSFGDRTFSYVLRDVIRYAYSKGVVMVASSGNSGSMEPHYPSGYSETISVGNSTVRDYISGDSNYGSTLDITAPGTEIISLAPGGGYETHSGTSAAAPFVSAAAAMLLSAGNYGSEDVRGMLKSTADDIERPGWDEKSGAGRLNIYRAVSTLAPSEVLFNWPHQDYTSAGETIEVRATILSAYFKSYRLMIGEGLNPLKWTPLTGEETQQADNKLIKQIDGSSLKDTSYTLRILLTQTNGTTMEQRVNFYVDRTPPEAYIISSREAYLGAKSTLLAEVLTGEKATVKLFFRTKGQKDFQAVSLDGFTTNNRFVKQLHWGFITPELLSAGSSVEYYFEAGNLAGLKTVIKNGERNFETATDPLLAPSSALQMPYRLPPGMLYMDMVSFAGTNQPSVILREAKISDYAASVYRFDGAGFIKTDSLKNRFVRAAGDFNANGMTDLLGTYGLDGFIDEQKSPGSAEVQNVYSKTRFFPVYAGDLDRDGFTELICSLPEERFLTVWQLDEGLHPAIEDTLYNFSRPDQDEEFSNEFLYTNAALTDNNADGYPEIWVTDADGDLMSFSVTGKDSYSNGDTLHTFFAGTSSQIASGDFDADGYSDIAVLFNSSKAYSIAPFSYLAVFSVKDGSISEIYSKMFIDQSSGFNTSFYDAEKSIRFGSLDGDKNAELAVFAYPYAYIIKCKNGQGTVTSFSEGVNSSSVFIGDLNKNGVPEVAMPSNDGISFYEFSDAQRPAAPYIYSAYSLDSTSALIKWKGEGEKYFIYRQKKAQLPQLIDSTVYREYSDKGLQPGTTYFYQIVSYLGSKAEKYSFKSTAAELYSHQPAEALRAVGRSTSGVQVYFSAPVNTTVENFRSFILDNGVLPSSVTPASEFSYLISYDKPLSQGRHRIVLQGLNDLYSSPVRTDTLVFIAVSDSAAPEAMFVQGYQLQGNRRIKLTFSLPPEILAALDISNYSISPFNRVVKAQMDQSDRKSVILDLQLPVGSVGRQYTLHVTGMFSDEESGHISVAKEAGSYVVITGSAGNIEDVYTYPNPARPGGTVTFANLTRNAEIIIFTLSGEKIRTLMEDDGDGGFQWDMKDEHGNTINSGIYLFRVVSLDEKNNETGEKIGKLAVIK